MFINLFNIFRPQAKAAAMTSAELSAILAVGMESSAGVSVSTSAAMRVTTVYACVRILAESIAQLPLKLYGQDRGGNKIVMTGDPLYTLLHHSPNSWMTSFEFRELMMTCLCLRGNFYAYVNRDNKGAAVELLPLRPEDVVVKQSDWVVTYDITINKTRMTVAARDIFHVRGMSMDGLVGVSPIAFQRNTIGLTIATENHGARTFRNGARPGGVLTHPGKLSDEALKHLRSSWQANHGGENVGGTAIIEEGMTYHPVAMSNEDSQFLETRQFQRTEICSIFRVPPHMVGDLTKSSFSNITQQSLEFVKYTILPWSRRIEAAIHRDLLTDTQRKSGVYAELLVDGLERADIETRYKAYNTGIMSGILSPNECRAAENRNAREGGDVFLQPLNMADGTKPPATDDGKKKQKNLSTRATMIDDLDDQDDLDDYEESEDEEFFYSDEVKGLNALADKFRPIFEDVFFISLRHECETIRNWWNLQLKDSVSRDFLLWLEKFYAGYSTRLVGDIKPLLREYAELVRLESLEMIGAGRDIFQAELDKFVREYADVYVKRHIASSIGQLTMLIESSKGDEELRGMVLDRMSKWETMRPTMIAADEVVRQAGATALATWKTAGITRFRWVTQGVKACKMCRPRNGKIVGVRRAFVEQGELLDGKKSRSRGVKKHPPIHRGCVCAIVPVTTVDQNLTVGKILVNAERATIPPEKFTAYGCNKNSAEPSGRNHSLVMDSVLGYNVDNWEELRDKIARGIKKYPAEFTEQKDGFDRYVVHMPIKGVRGEASIVKTAWMLRDETPSLTTFFVAKGPIQKEFHGLLSESL